MTKPDIDLSKKKKMVYNSDYKLLSETSQTGMLVLSSCKETDKLYDIRPHRCVHEFLPHFLAFY